MKRILSIFASAIVCSAVSAADIRINGNITQDTVWTNDNTYILDAQVYVIDGASLSIEPGTVVKGASLASGASALIISRGSKIFAMGTPSNPIIFTAESDPLDGSVTEGTSQLWGGVIILGAAPLNSESRGEEGDFTADPQVPYTDNIEGLENSPDNTWTEFGGLDPEDSSGIFRYVSIRHGGSVVGANNEINGLTMGGVGSGTIIEFVEVFANKDDGFEWFGGTVNGRYLVAAFGNDDSFDYDQGWTGKGQFWFTIGKDNVSDAMDHGGEHDGTVDFNQDGLTRGMGTIYNATYIGPGSDSGIDEGVFEINDDAGVRYYNSIFMSWAGHGVDVVDPDGRYGLTDMEDGATRIDFRNNIWFDIGDGTMDDLATATDVIAFLASPGKNNEIEDPMLMGVSRIADGGLDPRPASGSPVYSNALMDLPEGDSWYMDVDYQGAFGANNWLQGWTKLSQDGYIGESSERVSGGIYNSSVRTSLDIPAGEIVAVGLVVNGDAPRMVLIRADGPNIAAQNVANPASATSLQVYNALTGETLTDVILGWADSDQAAAIEMMSEYVGFPDVGDDTTSAMALLSLAPGNYSIAVTNPDGTGGETVISTTVIDQ